MVGTARAILAILILPTFIFAETVVWDAFKSSGKDKVWTNRDGYMGIVGNHVSTSGNIWLDAFPGNTGKYRLKWRIGAESDGQPKYAISIGGAVVKSGTFPYPSSGQTCVQSKSITEQKDLDLGTFSIRKGDKLNLKGTSVYPCGADHGSYCRWKTMTFTSEGTTGVTRSPRAIGARTGAQVGKHFDLQGRPMRSRSNASTGGLRIGTTPDGSAGLLIEKL